LWGAGGVGAAVRAPDFGLRDDGCFQVKLAMSEAVTNAILHGSDSVRATVEITVRAETSRLVFEVSDEGRDPATVDPIERLDDGGRGLELVSMVMDEVQMTRRDGGTLLRFVKTLEASPSTRARGKSAPTPA
jgi:anti-sigma regulatory factor (Ser/Thr protein kinase)